MMVLVFDLDDTLYEEQSFVRSGFRAVSEFIEQRCAIPADESYEYMLKILDENGRGQVFDRLLKDHQRYSKNAVLKCLQVYRSHQPNIVLSSQAIHCFNRFSHWPKYVVTDGNKRVQRNKMKALGLYRWCKRCIATYGYGVSRSKPSPFVFQKICEIEKVEPNQVVYIGDNPHKDFVGIKPLGFRTIRILQGPFRHLKKPAEYEADWTISSLDDLTERMLHERFQL